MSLGLGRGRRPERAPHANGDIHTLAACRDAATMSDACPKLCKQMRRGERRLFSSAPPPPALLELSAHPNGYLREAILHDFALHPHPAQLPAIVARLNDWVEQVRLAARLALRAHFKRACVPALLDQMPRLRHLYHCQRQPHRWLVIEVEEFLLKPAHKNLICAALLADGSARAREAFRLAAHGGLLPLEKLIALALASPDRLVAGAGLAWISLLPPARQSACYQLALCSPCQSIKNFCLRAAQPIAWERLR